MTPDPVVSELRAFAERATACDAGDPGFPTRPLAAREIDRLRNQSCSAQDWTRVHVSEAFDTRFYWGNHFIGRVVLGPAGVDAELSEGVSVPSGVYRSTVSDCVVGAHALVHNVGLAHRYVIDAGAVLATCGEVHHAVGSAAESSVGSAIGSSAASSFGNGALIDLGVETGERRTAILSERPFNQLAAICAADPSTRSKWNREGAAEALQMAAPFGLIGERAVVRNTGRLRSVYVGPTSRVIGAQLVEDATLLSDSDATACVGDGAIVRGGLIQWGGVVTDGAVVTRSLICESANVSGNARVSESVIGPCTVVGEGEVHASLLGPLVGDHHQSLLVAALWPGGRGNVGYGANVGSNHTGRLPDQEIRIGEGVFFGLGVNIKMPANFDDAPYTLIATGVDTLPQRVEMPFSLIAGPQEPLAGVPPAFNEIRPGWMLYDNLYALLRAERKFRSRYSARRSGIDPAVFRPATIDQVRRAAESLRAVGEPSGGAAGPRTATKRVYTSRDIAGIGKNGLSEPARAKGLGAYDALLRWYGLRGAYRAITANGTLDGEWGDPLANELFHKAVSARDRHTVIHLYLAAEGAMLDAAILSRSRDASRGPKIIDDYAAVRSEPDALISLLEAEYEALRMEALALLD